LDRVMLLLVDMVLERFVLTVSLVGSGFQPFNG
jgi:hypothetical protein